MEKESFMLIKETPAGAFLAVLLIIGLAVFILVSSAVSEENSQHTAVKKLNKKERQLQEKEGQLKQIERQLKATR
jgi:uncharacterized protein HemX